MNGGARIQAGGSPAPQRVTGSDALPAFVESLLMCITRGKRDNIRAFQRPRRACGPVAPTLGLSQAS